MADVTDVRLCAPLQCAPLQVACVPRTASQCSTPGRKDNARPLAPDGRVCALCGVSDQAKDLASPPEFVAWGYAYNKQTGRNVGTTCVYCRRVYSGERMALGGANSCSRRRNTNKHFHPLD